MKEVFLRKSFCVLAMCALLVGGGARAAIWNGTITGTYTDATIAIDADCVVDDYVWVETSVNSTITVTLGADRFIRAGDTNPRMFLDAQASSDEIIFDLTDSLSFTGDADDSLLIVVVGQGTVRFKLSNGKTVSFTAENSGVLGTRCFVDNRSSAGDLFRTGVKLVFSRDDDATSEHVHVEIGPKSILSYLGDDGEVGSFAKYAYIDWYPQNSGSGRTVLNIKDTGAMYIAASDVGTVAIPTLTLSDIDMTTIAIPSTPSNPPQNCMFRTFGADPDNASLLITNENATLTDLMFNPWQETSPSTSNRYGFIICTGGWISVGSDSYIDYVGLTNNLCPSPDIPASILQGKSVSQVVKERNASAFIADELVASTTSSNRATVSFQDNSAIVFRSGVDNEGSINWFDGEDYDFTIDPEKETTGQGNIVLAADGRLEFRGSNDGTVRIESKVEILSWEVDPTGGTVLVGGESPAIFPLRTFAKSGDNYKQYNSACFFINNRVNLLDTYLVHSDENHSVYEKDDVNSEPTYVGGETYFLLDDQEERPWIALYSSDLRLHKNAAFTGLDLLIPNPSASTAMAGPQKKLGLGNIESTLDFYYNGYEYDDGTGRQLVLGTDIGSRGCDPCCASISNDAHLNIYQVSLASDPAGIHECYLRTNSNDNTIIDPAVQDLTGIDGQSQVHTIYLGHSSNISVGSQGGTYVDPDGVTQTADTDPRLIIGGNYFSFETRGGQQACPELSAISGSGGIFVDQRGEFTIESGYRANIATMVTKSGDGLVNLPLSQVHFHDRVGIADWKLTLTAEDQTIIVDTGEQLSDYTLNWRYVTKDWTNTITPFLPYNVSYINSCTCPDVTVNNIASLPTVKGLVEQFQIKGSRLGFPVHLMVDEGWIKELIFLGSCDSGDASTGVIVVKENGRVGLGSKHKNRDSLGGSIKLGVNGVMIIADGNGRIDVNEDLIIDNVCHILKGPNFGKDSEGEDEINRLTFFSDCCRSITVKKGGILDLSKFEGTSVISTQTPEIIEFAGNVRLILEEGAKVVLGRDESLWGPTVQFTDQARCETSELTDLSTFVFGPDVTGIDSLRVRLVGIGTMQFLEDSVFYVADDTYVGVEVDTDCTDVTEFSLVTDILLDVGDRAQVLLGQPGNVNSSFQIGNTIDMTGSGVYFTLNLSGVNSLFKIASRGFFGMGVGIIDNFKPTPGEWLIDTLYNIGWIRVFCPAGTIVHDRIFSSASTPASLIAIQETGTADYVFDADNTITSDKTQATILGGANMVLVTPGDGSGVTPIVADMVGTTTPRVSAGIFSSKDVLVVKDITTTLPTPATGTQLFNYWSAPDFAATDGGTTSASQDEHNLLSFVYVDSSMIARFLTDEIVGVGGTTLSRKDFDYTLRIGAINNQLAASGAAPRSPVTVFELR